jgi:hypothetical protein
VVSAGEDIESAPCSGRSYKGSLRHTSSAPSSLPLSVANGDVSLNGIDNGSVDVPDGMDIKEESPSTALYINSGLPVLLYYKAACQRRDL